MRSLVLVLLLLACSSPQPSPDGGTAGGGTAGGGGSAGGGTAGGGTAGGGGSTGGGGGGTGGGGGGAALPACMGADVIETCVLAPDGGFAGERFTVDLAVVEVSDVAGGRCNNLDFSSSSGTVKRVVLDGGWTVIFRAPQLPAPFVTAGETVELALAGEYRTAAFTPPVSQTFVLSRAGQPFAFAATRSRLRQFELPDFGSLGLQVSSAGVDCTNTSTCRYQGHKLLFSLGTDAGVIERGATGRIGPYAITVENAMDALDTGFCDLHAQLRVAGVRAP